MINDKIYASSAKTFRLWELLYMVDKGFVVNGDMFKAINIPINMIIKYEDGQFIYEDCMGNKGKTVSLCSEMECDWIELIA